MLWNLTHNPFVRQPPRSEMTRRFVFTGRDRELLKLLDSAEQGEPCCLYGTYGMGKSMLMLEACRILKERHANIVPLYTCVDPGLEYKDFDHVVLAGIAEVLGDRGVQAPDMADDAVFGMIRRWIQAGWKKDLRVFAMVDDMDRPQDVEKIPAVINTVRALRDIGCGVCLPANPNQATHKFATAAQGILDRINLAPLELSEYIQMVARYLETARGRGLVSSISLSAPKIFLSYARCDVNAVDKLYDALAKLSFRPWMDKYDLLGGENWSIVIEREIPTSDFVILCLSRRSCKHRGYFRAEIGLALRKLNELLRSDIYLIPVRLEDCEIPDELSHLNCVDLFADGSMVTLERSIREGFRRRLEQDDESQPTAPLLNTLPFDEASIGRIIDRVGGKYHITPRMLNTACRSLLELAADQRVERISEDFVNSMWNQLGAQVLSSEGDIERCARLVRYLMEHEGAIDEDSLNLESVLEMLNRNHGGFADLLEVFGHFEDVFHVEDRDGNMTVLLSPLIDQDFIRNEFLKKTVEEFRQEFGRPGSDDRTEGFGFLEDSVSIYTPNPGEPEPSR